MLSLLSLFQVSGRPSTPEENRQRDDPDNDKPTMQLVNQRSDGSYYFTNLESADCHCPGCGGTNTYNESGSGDMEMGVGYYCLDCRFHWYMPVYDEDYPFVVRIKLQNESPVQNNAPSVADPIDLSRPIKIIRYY